MEFSEVSNKINSFLQIYIGKCLGMRMLTHHAVILLVLAALPIILSHAVAITAKAICIYPRITVYPKYFSH
jgi:hypothetical protein